MLSPVLVDSSVILDIATADPVWGGWSEAALAGAADHAPLVINPLIYAEVSIGFARIEELEEALPRDHFRRDPLPYEAAFLAGKAFLAYRRKGGRVDCLCPISTSEPMLLSPASGCSRAMPRRSGAISPNCT